MSNKNVLNHLYLIKLKIEKERRKEAAQLASLR